ncbi:MAG TPA: lanthionine synthetase C family protein [Pseudonocardiaceae bacterium]|nr:lanthionine synthetase C family protein [Pseudonocardiaceae bacterium]
MDPAVVIAHAGEHARGTLSGLAGTALLHARLSAIDDRFAAAAIEHWNHAAAHVSRCTGTTGGIFTGPGAVAASLILGSPYLRDPQRRHDQCAAAARWLTGRALAVADQYREQRRTGAPLVSWGVYDAINGLAGIGRVLLAAIDHGHEHAHAGLNAALVALTTIINTEGRRPGWWLPATAHPAAAAAHPSGVATTGMAHGIAGPLTLLAIAHTAGHRVPGQEQAIRAAAGWLLHWRDPATDTWPPHVTGVELDDDMAEPVGGRRDAWCYGTPGVSTALKHAAHALNLDECRAAADHAMRTLDARDPCHWDVEGPTLCHGYAGILQASHGYPDLAEHAAGRIIASADSHHPVLVQHRDHGIVHDAPGLLTGVAGTGLALADHAQLSTTAARTTCWDSILLLS